MRTLLQGKLYPGGEEFSHPQLCTTSSRLQIGRTQATGTHRAVSDVSGSLRAAAGIRGYENYLRLPCVIGPRSDEIRQPGGEDRPARSDRRRWWRPFDGPDRSCRRRQSRPGTSVRIQKTKFPVWVVKPSNNEAHSRLGNPPGKGCVGCRKICRSLSQPRVKMAHARTRWARHTQTHTRYAPRAALACGTGTNDRMRSLPSSVTAPLRSAAFPAATSGPSPVGCRSAAVGNDVRCGTHR